MSPISQAQAQTRCARKTSPRSSHPRQNTLDMLWAPERLSHEEVWVRKGTILKNLLMPLFLMGCFPVDFQEAKRPLRTKSVKRPIKVGKRPINEGKRPIKAVVLVGISVGCLMGCFRVPPPWRKTGPSRKAH